MSAYARWQSQGLRWIAALFTGAADHLERHATEPAPAIDPAPWEPLHACGSHDAIEDLRGRIHSRYL
jgi:hypothetical protein